MDVYKTTKVLDDLVRFPTLSLFLYSPYFLRLNQPPTQCIPSILSQGIKQPELEADHSSPSSDKVKNGGTLRPFLIHLHGVVLH
jgi:hypothetical protein